MADLVQKSTYVVREVVKEFFAPLRLLGGLFSSRHIDNVHDLVVRNQMQKVLNEDLAEGTSDPARKERSKQLTNTIMTYLQQERDKRHALEEQIASLTQSQKLMESRFGELLVAHEARHLELLEQLQAIREQERAELESKVSGRLSA